MQQKFKRHVLWIDLLDNRQYHTLLQNPERLLNQIEAAPKLKTVVIDEVQKIPRILDTLHQAIEKFKTLRFVLTGSSARKLLRGQANLLAGRAINFYLYPLSCFELGNNFNLLQHIQFGGLPQTISLKSKKEKSLFLETYVHTYLKEEIMQEQLVRNLQPFKSFLDMAAQLNGQPINYARFARHTHSDPKSIQNYFSVLEDTLIGFFIPPYSRSVRKQQLQAPKFYFFDTGVKRALDDTLDVPIKPQNFSFGHAFEHFILTECVKLNHYFRCRYKFSYCKTKSGAEIDLIVQRPRKKDLLVEIKSTSCVGPEPIKKLQRLASTWPVPHEAELWSCDPNEQKAAGVRCLPWQMALRRLFPRTPVT